MTRTRTIFRSGAAGLLASLAFCGIAIAQQAPDSETPKPATPPDNSAPQLPDAAPNNPAPNNPAPEIPAPTDPAPTNPAPSDPVPDRDQPNPQPAPADAVDRAPSADRPRTTDPADNRPGNRNPNRSDRDADRQPADSQPRDADNSRDADNPRDDNRRGDNQRGDRSRPANRGNTDIGLTFGTGAGGALVIDNFGQRSYFRDAGFRRGDRIVSAGGRRFNDQAAFYAWLGTVAVGQRVPIIVMRDGRETTLYWTPTQEFVDYYVQEVPSNSPNFLGIHVDQNVPDAVVVLEVDPNSPADNAGVGPQDVIRAVNDQQVNNPTEFADVTSGLAQSEPARLTLTRTFDVQIDPSQRGAIETRTSRPPAPTVTPAPVQQQPGVIVEPGVRREPAPSYRRGVFRRR
jgi:hypothetical protein